MVQIVLVRHGETEWSASGRHTGATDVPLTDAGERQARALGTVLSGRRFALVLTSPLQRATRTAALAGVDAPQVDPDLVEWDYGDYEGRTTADIRSTLGRPWTVWADGVVGGETIEAVAARATRVLERCRAVLDRGGDVALFGHGHQLRVLAATWVGLPPVDGARLALSAGSWSALGFEHETAVIDAWNLPPGGDA